MTTTHLPLHEKRKILLYLGAHDDALFKWTQENLLRPGKDHVVFTCLRPKRRKEQIFNILDSTNSAISANGHESVVWEDVDEARNTLERYGLTLNQEHITNEEHVVPGDPRELLPRFARDHSGMNMVVASEASKKINIGSSLGEKLAKEVGSQCTIVMIRNPQQLSNGIPTMVKEE